MTICSIDFETRSTVDLRRSGVYPYAEHPDTDVICMAYAIGDVEPRVWVPPRVWSVLSVRPYPHARWDDLHEFAMTEGEFRAHNAQFERIIWRDLLGPRYGFPIPNDDRWVCTAAEAAAMSLPRDLKTLSHVLKVSEQKDDAGHQLMLQMCRPRSKKGGVLTWWDETDPEKLKCLIEYCKQDVRAERACAAKLRRLCKMERKVYLLDQTINDRGIRLDMPLIEAADKIVKAEVAKAGERLSELTDGQVTAVTNPTAIRHWANDRLTGTDCSLTLLDLTKATVRDALVRDDVPDEVRTVLQIRADVGKSGTAKLKSMKEVRCEDDYARGLLLYHGAGTGRWTGKLIQPQNFPRPEIRDPEKYIPTIMVGYCLTAIPPLVVVSSLLRSMLMASPDHRMLAADYSQIEARVLGWFAGEPYGDLEYEKMAATIFQVPLSTITKDSDERQVGKTTILGAGFGMGPPRYQEQVYTQTGIVLEDDMAVRGIRVFREKKPGIPAYWREIESGAMRAVERPGEVVRIGSLGNIAYVVRNQFLWCILPSGRPLAYALPTLRERTITWVDIKGEEHSARKLGLDFMGVNSLTRKWERQHAYGGLLTENVVQATARDLMAMAMLRLEVGGYRPVLTVHDEIVGDVPNEHGSLDAFLEIMAQTPKWAGDLTVEVEGWENERLRK